MDIRGYALHRVIERTENGETYCELWKHVIDTKHREPKDVPNYVADFWTIYSVDEAGHEHAVSDHNDVSHAREEYINRCHSLSEGKATNV